MNENLTKYLREKHGLDQLKEDEPLEQPQVDSGPSISPWTQFAAGVGATMAGRSPSESAQAFEQMRQKAEETNPMSKKSQAFRQMMEAKFPDVAKSYGEKWQEVSAGDADVIFRPLQLKETIESRKEQARLLGQTRKEAALEREDIRTEKKEEKKTALLDKKKEITEEIEDRRENINYALDSLKTMIEKKGTWEAFGEHNQTMDRLIEQVATDMAKLQDPKSVARPSEVESVKKNLIQSGFSNKNATALDIINSFRGEVDRRANLGYKVRGVELPSAPPPPPPPPSSAQQIVPEQKQAAVNNEFSRPEKIEVERKMKDGKIAIFDANTQSFIRWK